MDNPHPPLNAAILIGLFFLCYGFAYWYMVRFLNRVLAAEYSPKNIFSLLFSPKAIVSHYLGFIEIHSREKGGLATLFVLVVHFVGLIGIVISGLLYG